MVLYSARGWGQDAQRESAQLGLGATEEPLPLWIPESTQVGPGVLSTLQISVSLAFRAPSHICWLCTSPASLPGGGWQLA